jgi:hypothetical protein
MYAGIEWAARRILPNLEQYVVDFRGGAAVDDDYGFSLSGVSPVITRRIASRNDMTPSV